MLGQCLTLRLQKTKGAKKYGVLSPDLSPRRQPADEVQTNKSDTEALCAASIAQVDSARHNALRNVYIAFKHLHFATDG